MHVYNKSFFLEFIFDEKVIINDDKTLIVFPQREEIIIEKRSMMNFMVDLFFQIVAYEIIEVYII